jgi:hypothetical protein
MLRGPWAKDGRLPSTDADAQAHSDAVHDLNPLRVPSRSRTKVVAIAVRLKPCLKAELARPWCKDHNMLLGSPVISVARAAP